MVKISQNFDFVLKLKFLLDDLVRSMDPWFWLNELPELYRVLALFAFEHISDSVRMAGREKHRRSILRPIFRFFRNHSRKTEGPILTRRPKGMIVTYMTWLKHKNE